MESWRPSVLLSTLRFSFVPARSRACRRKKINAISDLATVTIAFGSNNNYELIKNVKKCRKYPRSMANVNYKIVSIVYQICQQPYKIQSKKRQ